MQAAGATALLTKNQQGDAAAKPASRHGAEPHAKVPFHSVLGKALGAKSGKTADAKDTASALAALHAALKKGQAPGKHHPALPKTEAAATPHSDGARHPLAAVQVLAEEGGLTQPAEPGKQIGKQEKKKAEIAARHADGLDAGRLSIAAVLPGAVKGLPGGRPDHAGLPAPKDAAQHIEAAAATARKSREIRVHVVDLRKKTADGPAGDSTATPNIARPAGAERDPFAPGFTRGAPAPALAADTHKPAPAIASPFAGALERLRDMAGSELTRAAGIILRDGGGEIKLVLKPESLGNVRIRMNLVDNSIEGRIIVDNPAVKHVFEGNLASLMRALTAEGFQTASLQVSVGGQNGDAGRQDKEPARRVPRVGAAEGFERNVPGVEAMSLGDLLVNLFV